MINEEQTILLAKEGSIDAFYQLYQNHWERIWRIALRNTRSRDDAEDIMQDTFIHAFKKIHTYKFHLSSSFISWLNTICLNRTIDFLRRKKSKHSNKHLSLHNLVTEPMSSNPSPHQIVEEKEAGKKIKECLQILSPRQRIIFDMRFNQHMDVREIAECLRCSTSNVKTQIFRSLRKLRKILVPIWGKQ